MEVHLNSVIVLMYGEHLSEDGQALVSKGHKYFVLYHIAQDFGGRKLW